MSVGRKSQQKRCLDWETKRLSYCPVCERVQKFRKNIWTKHWDCQKCSWERPKDYFYGDFDPERHPRYKLKARKDDWGRRKDKPWRIQVKKIEPGMK